MELSLSSVKRNRVRKCYAASSGLVVRIHLSVLWNNKSTWFSILNASRNVEQVNKRESSARAVKVWPWKQSILLVYPTHYTT